MGNDQGCCRQEAEIASMIPAETEKETVTVQAVITEQEDDDVGRFEEPPTSAALHGEKEPGGPAAAGKVRHEMSLEGNRRSSSALSLSLDPEILRSVRLRSTLKGGGRLWRKSPIDMHKEQRLQLWEQSEPTEEIDVFFSHTWQTAGHWKYLALLFETGSSCSLAAWGVASATMTLLCCLGAVPLPFGPTTRVLKFEAVTPMGPWIILSGMAASLLGLIASPHAPGLLRRDESCFLDKVCIHQEDPDLMRRGVYGLGVYLRMSKELRVLWSSPYFTRLWCVFEIAAYAALNSSGRVVLAPVFMGWMQVLLLLCSYYLSVVMWLVTIADSVNLSAYLIAISPLCFVTHALRRSFHLRQLVVVELENFDLNAADCRVAADRDFVHEAIIAWYGSTNAFTQYVRGDLRMELLKSIRTNVPRIYVALLVSTSTLATDGWGGGYPEGLGNLVYCPTPVPYFHSVVDAKRSGSESQNELPWQPLPALWFAMAGSELPQAELHLKPRKVNGQLQRTAAWSLHLRALLGFCAASGEGWQSLPTGDFSKAGRGPASSCQLQQDAPEQQQNHSDFLACKVAGATAHQPGRAPGCSENGNATFVPMSKCQEDPCVDCQWTDWEAWSPCSVSCSGGKRSRHRAVKVQAEGDGQECIGNSTQTEDCGEAACPVDCEVSDWTAWTPCAPFCHGTTNRSRSVHRQAANGGLACGNLSEVKSCTNFCMDCKLSDWGEWSTCTRSCAGGSRSRTRNEVFVTREHPSSSLLELGARSRAFGYEKKLGLRCDAGHQRTLDGAGKTPQEAQARDGDVGMLLEPEEKSCSYVKKEIGEGVPCTGEISEKEECSTQACPVDCRQSEWTDWTECSPWCSGTSKRTRTTTREPANGGVACGSIAEVQNCTNVCVDCEWGSWVAWSNCPVSCGGAKQKRSRNVLVQQAGRGKPCQGNSSEVRGCGELACPVDCSMEDWTDWTSCTPYCKGSQSRTRSILVDPANGGKACGETSLVVNCSNACVDCVVSEWSAWSPCSVSCGSGEQSRKRVVLVEPEGLHLPCLSGASFVLAAGQGAPCPADLLDEKEGCNATECPVDCAWQDWAPWNGCPATCGGAIQNRTRGKTEEKFGGVPCEGCGFFGCRLSKNIARSEMLCSGEALEQGSCAEMVCPQEISGTRPGETFLESRRCEDCLWSEWEAWGNCTKLCGGGKQSRYRYIKQDVMGEGSNCTGSAKDERTCNEESLPTPSPNAIPKRVNACVLQDACPKDCEFLDWEEWSSCSVSCGAGGNRTRSRKVDAEINGGAPCDPAVPLQETVECGTSGCPRDCAWGDWGTWTNCSKTCGLGLNAGITTRHRVQAVTAAFGGKACEGKTVHTTRCNEVLCPVNCEWEPWTAWTECVMPCGSNGTRQRSRGKIPPAHGGEDCVGDSTETSACTVLGGCSVNCTWEDWNEWTACSASCGEGNRVRFRFVADEARGPHGQACHGQPQEEEFCNPGNACPVDCAFNDWKDWGACEPMPCGPAKKLRARTKLAARYGGKPCDGNATEVEECTVPGGRVIECDENGKPVTSTSTTMTTTTTLTTTTRTNTTTTITATSTTTQTVTNTTTTPSTTTPAPIVVTTVGLNPESAAAAVAASAEESVQGSEELEVTDPDKFVKDPAAKEALKEAIAQEVGVSVDAVIIKGETVEPQAPAVLLQSHGGKARRRETPSGRVNVSYEIVPQMSGKTVDEVMDKMEHMDPQEAFPQPKPQHGMLRTANAPGGRSPREEPFEKQRGEVQRQGRSQTLCRSESGQVTSICEVEDTKTVVVSMSTGNTVS
ncbi:HMCN1 [Symbiodinium sp. CCMP2592]|nr:HMCN1 [Symbiodinium sp. CCMP2592]